MITLDDLLYTRERTVEPEVMLGVGEDADVGFELCRNGRHGRGGDWGDVRLGGVSGTYGHLPLANDAYISEHNFSHGIE